MTLRPLGPLAPSAINAADGGATPVACLPAGTLAFRAQTGNQRDARARRPAVYRGDLRRFQGGDHDRHGGGLRGGHRTGEKISKKKEVLAGNPKELLTEYSEKQNLMRHDGDVMLDKSAYYHGAAIISLLEDVRCRSIRKRPLLGYVVYDLLP